MGGGKRKGKRIWKGCEDRMGEVGNGGGGKRGKG